MRKSLAAILRLRDQRSGQPPRLCRQSHTEILEETGLTVVVERLTGVYKNLARGVVAPGLPLPPGTATSARLPRPARFAA